MELIVNELDSETSISLLLSCKQMYEKLSENLNFWRLICRYLGLDTFEWTGGGRGTSYRFWKCIYQEWRTTSAALTSCQYIKSERICAELSNLNMQVKMKTVNQEVFQLPGDEANLPKQKTLSRKLISDTIIGYGYSEAYFVLFASSCTSFESELTVWSRQASRVQHCFSLRQNSPNIPM